MFGGFLKAVGLDSFLNLTSNEESKDEEDVDDSGPNRPNHSPSKVKHSQGYGIQRSVTSREPQLRAFGNKDNEFDEMANYESSGPSMLIDQSISRHNSLTMANSKNREDYDDVGGLSGGEFSIFAMNRGRERFLNLLAIWQKSKDKKMERATNDAHKEQTTSEDLRNYLPDYEQEANGGIMQPKGDIETQFRSLYFQETAEGPFPLKNKILRQELK